jgi:hypothetical protein
MIVACVALIVALGGTSYAVATLNGADLKNRSVPGRKLKKDTATGVEVKESTLGKVPKASNADVAKNANHAAAATSATTAGTALAAGNATTLGGKHASDFLASTRLASTSGAVFLTAGPQPDGSTAPLVTAGPFTLTEACVDYAAPNDVVRLMLGSTVSAAFQTADAPNAPQSSGAVGPGPPNQLMAVGGDLTLAGPIPFTITENVSSGASGTVIGATIHGMATLQITASGDCKASVVVFP